jgi:hypothetical protein
VGLRARSAAVAPSGETRNAARTVSLAEDATTIARIMELLPDPASLEPGTLVIVPGHAGKPGGRSLAQSVLAVFGRTKTVARSLRCSALLARGYVAIGAAEDEARADLAWGRAPHDAATTDAADD